MTGVWKDALLSDDGRYRYKLIRVWDHALPSVLFVGLNPSTADAETDDPTVRRCVRFARDWGYGGVRLGNLFAWRATSPKGLPRLDATPILNPVGEAGEWRQGYRMNENDRHLLAMSERSAIVVAAWGATPMPYGWDHRPAHVVRLLDRPLFALGLTAGGHPRHPLYVPAATAARPWGTPGKAEGP